jgi:LETM1 and EF-hand domain-containing protein 1, mitochondrial
MSLNRSAAWISPLLLRSGPASVRRLPRSLPRNLPAIAILLPRHAAAMSTETSTSSAGGGGANYPPPGFSSEQAKKPLAQESQQKKAKDDAAATKKGGDSVEKLAIPRDGPTSHPKTDAVEKQALAELAAEQATAEKVEEAKALEKKKEDKKLTIWERVKKEVNHYWDGTKLLVTEVRISSKLALKMAAGYELTRREYRQVSLSL